MDAGLFIKAVVMSGDEGGTQTKQLLTVEQTRVSFATSNLKGSCPLAFGNEEISH
jgi:hypothetical protein